mgnify:CR=1 FL=1
MNVNKIDKNSSLLVTELNGEKSNLYFSKPKDLKLPKGVIQNNISNRKQILHHFKKHRFTERSLFIYKYTRSFFR